MYVQNKEEKMQSQIDEASWYSAISGMDWIVWDWYDYLWVVGGIEHLHTAKT